MHLNVRTSTQSETCGSAATRRGSRRCDIHSPRVPSVSEIAELLERAVDELPLRQVWVNPDCGLKTRGYPETVSALHNLVEATLKVRQRAEVTV